ncbi:cob(I)yrinic acid a,c-diamide adenosyltransferase [bacterium]|nr:cob(I)yrinic acid a,c-diamide adenosyltransferase [bacterium]
MAINITRVYTRTGDAGTTALVGGERVAKDSRRVECYGELDELNAILGLARSFNAQGDATPARRRLDDILTRLQNELFDLGSELATPPEAEYEGMFTVGADDVRALERIMDACQRDLEPLRSFVLPGGGPVSAVLHHARTVCRRAERQIIRLAREEPIGAQVIPYVNRLSDLLFVLSRWIGKQNGEAEYLWQRGLRNRDRPAAARKRPSASPTNNPARPGRRGKDRR